MRFPTKTQALYQTMHNAHPGYISMSQGIRRLPQWAHILGDEPYCSRKILEIGCGNGQLCKLLSSFSMGFQVTGLDVVSGMYDREGYEFVTCDLKDRMPFDNNSFDLTLSFDVIEHLSPVDVERHIADMFRVSKKVAGTVACFPSSVLHLTVEPPEFWIEMLSRYSEKPISYRVFEKKVGKTVLFFTKEGNRNEDIDTNINGPT